MPRLDTRLESEGAEYLVLGQLLVQRIAAYKAYVNTEGYDLVAVDAERGTSARIQVKSRWQTRGANTRLQRRGSAQCTVRNTVPPPLSRYPLAER